MVWGLAAATASISASCPQGSEKVRYYSRARFRNRQRRLKLQHPFHARFVGKHRIHRAIRKKFVVEGHLPEELRGSAVKENRLIIALQVYIPHQGFSRLTIRACD